ncbi:MAG: galactose-1-phosphate uridylyltransferase [Tissierellia bacterium]|nr:galactose-1-phosphate uridylyltransferase [Tissierellia bacterium]
MAELRYNPLLDDWTMVSANRSKRPDMPKDYCPFCPDSGKVPVDYDVYCYDNDFPILSQNPPEPDQVGSAFYKTAPSYGKCEVILYSPDHYGNLKDLSSSHMKKLVHLWKERYETLSQDPKIKYVFPFENRGKEVGVTMPHPHGQIYAYSKMPLRLRIELENAMTYFEENGENIYDRILQEEIEYKERIVTENNTFSAFVPFFGEYPYGIYIFPKKSLLSFSDFEEKEIGDFANILKEVTTIYDGLFDKVFPYMMGIYNAPTSHSGYKDLYQYFRFHVKFFPPLRGENSIKYNASSETAAWVHGNPRKVEDCAKELREVREKLYG